MVHTLQTGISPWPLHPGPAEHVLAEAAEEAQPATVSADSVVHCHESILTLSITVWYNAPTKQDIQSLQRVIRSAEKITGCHKLQQT